MKAHTLRTNLWYSSREIGDQGFRVYKFVSHDSASLGEEKAWFAEAFARSLSAYVADAPLETAAIPLVELAQILSPGWTVGLFHLRPFASLSKAEFICGPDLAMPLITEIERALSAVETEPAPHELVFERFESNQLSAKTKIAIAKLLVSDDHAIGVLAFVWNEPEQISALPAATSTLQTVARAMTLMMEDRLSLVALVQREAVLSAILDMAPDPIIRIAQDGTIASFNRSAESVFGYTSHEVIDQPITILMTPDHAAQHQNYIDRYLATGERRLENWRRRFPAVRKDGGQIFVELAVSDIVVDGGPQFIGIVRDVSERVKEEKRQERQRWAIQHAAQLSALGEMAASIAHEVNQPLTAISNYLDAAISIAETPCESDRARLVHFIGRARDQAKFGADIIRRAQRLTSPSMPARSMINLNDAVKDVLSYMSTFAEDHDVAISADFDAHLPLAYADPLQIQQVVANLVRNAIDAVANCERRTIHVQSVYTGDAIEIQVDDSGAGVPAEERDAIFEPFYTTRSCGTGLGLAISKSIVHAHGGNLSIEDNDGGGARFRLRLPVAGS